MYGVGSALQFDGNDYISIPDDPSLHQQRLTVETWARRKGSPGQWRYLVAKGGDGCEAASYALYSSANGDEVRIWRAALPVGDIWSLINSGLRREPAAPLPEDAGQWFSGAR